MAIYQGSLRSQLSLPYSATKYDPLFKSKTEQALIPRKVIGTGNIKAIFVMLLICISSGMSDLAVAAKTSPDMEQELDKIHREIIEEALSGTISSANLKIVVDGCAKDIAISDKKAILDATGETAAPFTNRLFSGADREIKRVINFAGQADTNADDRARALYHLGQVLRPLQDFYLFSNYLELKLADKNVLDPYGIELINWSKTARDSRSAPSSGSKFESLSSFEYGDRDKSSPAQAEGAKTFGKATYFSMAKELALKETQRQWNVIERLLNVKYAERAPKIINALKNGSCPENFDPEEVP